MKKRLLALALVVVLLLSIAAIQASAAAEMKIYRLSSAPKQDGIIEDGEYYQLADKTYAFKYEGDNKDKDAANADKTIYAGYDDNYLYLAAKITCENHINEWVFVSDGAENDYNIFNGHCAKIGVTSVNPATDADCIATLTNDKWGWSDAFKSCIGRQFTVALTSDTGIQLSGVHFSHSKLYQEGELAIYTDPITNANINYNPANDADLPMDQEFFAVSHDDSTKYDVYEIKLPWGWIDYKTDKKGNTGDNIIPFDRKDGTYCGLSMDIATGDIDGDVYGNEGLAWATFGADNQIYFGDYVPLYLAGAADASAVASTKVGAAISAGNSGTAGTTTTGAASDATTTTKATESTTTAAKASTTTTAKKADSTTTTKASDDTKEEDKSNTGLIIGVIIGAVVLIAAIVVVIIVVKKKKAAPAEAKKDDKK